MSTKPPAERDLIAKNITADKEKFNLKDKLSSFPQIFKREKGYQPALEVTKPPEKQEPAQKTEDLPKIRRANKPQAVTPVVAPAAAPVVTKKTETYQEIEEILSEGLAEVYQSLDEKEQAEFRRKGEEAVTKIEELFLTFKLKAKLVLEIIKDWLKVIPKVNKYFLEQQSKIKTDQIMVLSKKNRKVQYR